MCPYRSLEGVAFRYDYWDAQHQYRQRPQLLIAKRHLGRFPDAHLIRNRRQSRIESQRHSRIEVVAGSGVGPLSL